MDEQVRAHLAGTDPRAVVLVEGISDQFALEALAERRGRNLDAEGISVLPIGGAQSIGRVLSLFVSRGLGLRRTNDEQLRRFMGSGGRKIRYARLLVEALDLDQVPRPLDLVLAGV